MSLRLASLREALRGHRARELEPGSAVQAAVAVIVREPAGVPELLMIERARRAGDPWSGHMAFPGGRLEPEDPDLRATAERETAEEVGIDLSAGELLGRLDDLCGPPGRRPFGIVISAFVYHLPDPPIEPRLNHEVVAALWVPIPWLQDPGRRIDYLHPGYRETYPGVVVGDPRRHVVWGLTYRFLEIFFATLDVPFPRSRQEA